MTLISQIKQHLSQASITQAQLARETGINAGALSAYLSQNYKGNIADVEAKLTAYLEKRKPLHGNLWKPQPLLKRQPLVKFSKR